MFTELETGQWHRVQVYCTEFRPNRLTNVEVTDSSSLVPRSKVRLSLGRISLNSKCKQNFVHAPSTGCVHLTRDNICEQQIRLAFHLRPQ